MRRDVTLSMIVRDGAATLDRCLGSIRDLVDEIVIADTGSTDGSQAIARDHGARVIDFAWTDSFAAARNASLRAARGGWVVWIDSDEWLDGPNRDRFATTIERVGTENLVVFMHQHSPQAESAGGVWSVHQPRLFRNVPGLEWRSRVHEQILASCIEHGARAVLTDVVIQHSGYQSAGVAAAKAVRNRRLVLLDLADDPGDPYRLFQAGRLDAQHGGAASASYLRRALAQVPANDPLRRQILGLLVANARASGDAAHHRASLVAALDRYPNDTALLAEAAALAVADGDLVEAERAYSALVTREPDPDEFFGSVDLAMRGWQARHELAWVLLRQGRAAEAEAQWQTAIRDQPTVASLWVGLAECHLHRRRWDAFEQAFHRLVELSSGGDGDVGVPIRSLRIRADLAQRSYSAARTALDRWLADSPTLVEARLLLSRLLLLSGDDLDAAEASLHAVLALDPANAEALAHLAAFEDDPTESLDDPPNSPSSASPNPPCRVPEPSLP